MRKTWVAIGLVAALGMVLPAQQAPAQVSIGVSVRLGDFYDELSPYGEWVDCRYGDCWVPRGVGAGWQPYSNGEWIYTRYGWTWVSSDPWGGDPYHYGTWDFVDRYGWVWVPGTVWAPAWVTWSYSDRYVGWAPMPPTIRFGVSGYSGRPVIMNQTQYVFVPTNQFVGSNVQSVRVEARRNAEVFRQAKPVTRFEVSGGVLRNAAVPLATVQKATGRRVETREISTARTTPRNLSSSGVARTGRFAIVAPAREMKAARASRQKGAPQAAPPQHPQPQAGPKPQARPEQQARPPQAATPQRKEARHPQAAKPQREEAQPPQAVRPQREEARPPQAAAPQRHEARPPQAAKPQREARPPQAAAPQREEARPPQAARPQREARPPQAAGPQREANPAGQERGKSENKGKKDPPGKDGRPD